MKCHEKSQLAAPRGDVRGIIVTSLHLTHLKIKENTHTHTHTRTGGGGEGQHLSAFPKRFCICNALIYEQEKKRKENLKGKAKREKVVLLKNSHSKAEECMLQGGGEGGRGERAELNRLIGAERLSQSQAKTKKPKSKCPKKRKKKNKCETKEATKRKANREKQQQTTEQQQQHEKISQV